MAPPTLQLPELERRLLRWTGSSNVPRYPFFEGPATGSPSVSPLSPHSSFTSTPSSYYSFSPSSTPSVSPKQSIEDLRRWFNDIELAASDCDVPVEQYPDVAMYFLRGDLKDVMKERKEAYVRQTRKKYWDWRDFKEDLGRLVEEAVRMIISAPVPSLASDALEQLRLAHPYIASSVKLGLIIGGTAVLLPTLGMMAWKKLNAVSPPALNSPHAA